VPRARAGARRSAAARRPAGRRRRIGALVRRIAAIEPLDALRRRAREDRFADAFEDAAASRLFFDALFGLLSVPVPSRARFDKLFSAAAGLGVSPSSAWALATALPFVAQPQRHVVLWPKSTRVAAERLGCDLRYDPSPSWTTYSALRAFAAQILERLKGIGAQDFVDVDAFLHVIATRKPQGAQGADRAAARSRRTK
jgi:hypothetical protein